MLTDILRLIRFDKPVGTLLLLWPTLSAVFVAANGHPPLYIVVIFSLGVFLTRSAGCAVNDMWDADFDKHVARTKDRPVASGRLTRKQALLCALLLSIIAFLLVLIYLKVTTIFLSMVALVIFMTYPLMKRFFPLPQAYLGIAFSIGILMAFVEITGQVTFIAWLLFVANLCWVFGYDTIYALCDKDDDLQIGIKTSAITLGRHTTLLVGVCYNIYILLLFWIGVSLHLGFMYYLGMVVITLLLVQQIKVLLSGDKKRYFKMFMLNNWVGMLGFITLSLSVSWKS